MVRRQSSKLQIQCVTCALGMFSSLSLVCCFRFISLLKWLCNLNVWLNDVILRFCQLLPPRNLTDVCVSVSCYFLAMSSSSDAAMSQGAPPRVSVHVTVETDGARLTISLEAGRSVESELGCSMGLDLLNEYLSAMDSEDRFKQKLDF